MVPYLTYEHTWHSYPSFQKKLPLFSKKIQKVKNKLTVVTMFEQIDVLESTRNLCIVFLLFNKTCFASKDEKKKKKKQ